MKTQTEYKHIGEVHWKKALEDELITVYQLFAKKPKNFVLGESQGKINFRSSSNKVTCTIIIDDEFIQEKLRTEIYPYCKNKTQLQKFVDDTWIDTKRLELENKIQALKAQAEEMGLNFESLLKK